MSATLPAPAPRPERFWLTLIAILSIVVVAAVAFLILGPRPDGVAGRLDVSALPTVNATFNGLAGVCLVAGYALIRRKRFEAHRRAMLGAFAASGGFFVSYTLYHAYSAGPRPYQGPWPALYYAVLISHIVLAAAVVPLALITLYRGWHWETAGAARHRRIARVALPVWLYVSATGVIIWAMLYA